MHSTLRTLTLALFAVLLAAAAVADTEKYRLSWRDDPTSTMVIGWVQDNGADETVYYDTVDHGNDWMSYAFSQAPDRSVNTHGQSHRFVRLSGLLPDTAYYFVIRDDRSVSPRMWFKTAPDTCANFTIVAGGDSRNNRGPRQDANAMVSKLRPLFVYFGGDYTFDGDDNGEIQDWLDDWQGTISNDGRIYPILAARGNHESNANVVNLFDSPNGNVYFALSFGGQQLRTYTLNSEITAGGNQGNWLANDLQNVGSTHFFRMAQYHKPMRPHQAAKSEGVAEYAAWAQTFYDNQMDLVVECDSHVLKRTWPVRPSNGPGSDEGFIRDDASGTVYIGEGGWGAPLRASNDDKNWTRNSDSENQVQWIHVTPTEMTVRTILTDNVNQVGEVDDTMPLALPNNLDVWSPSQGAVVTIPLRASVPDSDGDGVPDACDACPLDDPDDTDGDGVCDSDDQCNGFDDNLDADGDGTPDDCDACPMDNPDDTDGDGVCDSDDICPGFNDAADADGDGVPDGCDACPQDDPDDTDGDGVCDSDDICPGFDDGQDGDADTVPDGCDQCPNFDDRVDVDGDGAPDFCDPCPQDNPDDTDVDGVCDSDDVCPGFDDMMDADSDLVPDGCDACENFDDAIGAPAVGPGASLRAGPGGMLAWAPVTDATEYRVQRGTIPAAGMASRGGPYNHDCEWVVPTADHVDADLPGAAGAAGYYYLVGAANPCGPAPDTLGQDSLGSPRPVPPTCQ